VLIDVQRAGPSTGMPTRTQQADILACAYASHGDTRHVLLFPSTPRECFDYTALAFDLSERLQTPVIVMSDLDLGMNDHMSEPFAWDDTRRYDRGKVYDAAALEALEAEGKRYGRYLDVDGDGICYRTYPGTHPRLGAFFTRGTSRDPYAIYTEDGDVYAANMDRLVRKFATARNLVPQAVRWACNLQKVEPTRGMLFFGTSRHAVKEAMDMLTERRFAIDALELKAFPFGPEVAAYIAGHQQVFVVEQNRDGQMRSLLINELGISPEKLVPVLNYDGRPLTAGTVLRGVLGSIESREAGQAGRKVAEDRP
jgi:2-oxoglutarate ferredoxin oxidoreductase subunit alpha